MRALASSAAGRPLRLVSFPSRASVDATPLQLGLAALAATAGAAVNAIAGGGTLITFPTLIAIGIPPIVANATSSVALWPGTVGSMWGYRRELVGARAWAIRFAIPSLLGGIVGALLLLRTSSERFSAIVPFLVLGATVLFMGQGPLGAYLRRRQAIAREALAGAGRSGGTVDKTVPLEPARGVPPVGSRQNAGRPDAHTAEAQHPAGAMPATAGQGVVALDPATSRPEQLAAPPVAFLVYQFLVSIYGGYFGAGMGILMLAALGFMGLVNIHQMNGLKNWGGTCINLVAVTIFAVSGIVNWPIALVMAIGAAIGGYAGSGLAQRVEQRTVRRAIIGIGLASGVWLLVQRV